MGPQSHVVWVQVAASDAQIHMGHKPCDPVTSHLQTCLHSGAFQGIICMMSHDRLNIFLAQSLTKNKVNI